MIEGWKYYNHAAIPTCAPHEVPDINPIKNGDVWRADALKKGSIVFFARYVTDFDCAEETSFWYVIKESPFALDDLDKKYQKHIKKSLERCEVRRINPIEYIEDLYSVYQKAYETYKVPDNYQGKESFVSTIRSSSLDYWAAFSRESGEMAGWMSCRNNGTWTETVSAKYDPSLKTLFPSDAIHYAILDYYLNQLGHKYINSGSRNISHVTNVQDYKIKHWNFKRAHCKLHVVYNPKVRWVINLIYPFRRILECLDGIKLMHQINAVMIMESIVRKDVK
ncbi:MAG: hypothetical protein J6Y37_05080 [Paludibacteraceae bacterium]|nr:hypothetical protein [Paludibacteraceae bacterium]